MRNSTTNLTLASLDDIEKPRDFSDVSLTHFAAEPHNKLGALRGGRGVGWGGRKREGLFCFNSVMTKTNFYAFQGENILLLLHFKFNSVILALCMLKNEYG